MRRAQHDRTKLKPVSQSGSIAGEDADLSDLDPSETGSQGGLSNATGSSGNHKKYMTIEEREAAYNEARSRIFMDFEEKEKAKEKDMSANSSTFSQVSGSASTSAGRDSGSVGDIEDSLSSAATESEWSGPVTRNEKPRRSGSVNTSAGSSRSLRSFNNGGSSRNSRAASPSFSYASLYEPPPASYDQPQYIGHPPMGYNHGYMYPPYPLPHGQPMGQGAMPHYPYYQPYQYHQQHPHSDPTSPSMGEPMFHPQPHPHSQSQQQLPYPPQYMWPPGHHPPPPQPPQHTQSAPPQPVHSSGTPSMPPPQGSGYPPQFIPPSSQYGHYPTPFYPQHHQAPPSTHPSHPPQPMNSGLYHPDNSGQGHGSVIASPNPSVDSHNGRRGHNNSRRNAPKVRTAWSYGPGPGGFQHHNDNVDVVGPRLTPSRRTSGNSSAGSRTPGDEASSTAVSSLSAPSGSFLTVLLQSSSTTSSSSRHTYTSTSTTSKHPLPARPDWAVGLKAQPTLSPRGHHDQHQNSRNPSNRNGPQQNVQHLPPVSLQPADFPPLSNMPSNSERRTPAVSGAWNNPTSNKSIMTPASSGPGSHGSALVRYPNGGGPPEGKRSCQERGTDESSIEESSLAGKMELMTLDGAGEKAEGLAPPTEESAGR